MANEKNTDVSHRLVRCVNCSSLHPGAETDGGTVVPVTTGLTRTCPRCGSTEFDEVYL